MGTKSTPQYAVDLNGYKIHITVCSGYGGSKMVQNPHHGMLFMYTLHAAYVDQTYPNMYPAIVAMLVTLKTTK